MFDFLKKKIGGFIDGLTRKEEKKAGEKPPERLPEEVPETRLEPEKEKPVQPTKQKPEIAKPVPEKKPEPKPLLPKLELPKAPKLELPKAKPEKQKSEPEKAKPAPTPKIETKPEIAKPITLQKPVKPKPETSPKRETEVGGGVGGEVGREKEVGEVVVEATKRETQVGVVEPEEKPKERIKLGILGTVKGIITREVEISEGDVKEMLEGLELELLEADVEMGVAEGITQELRGKLIGSKVAKGKLHSFVSGSIRDTLVDVLTNEKSFDIVERVEASEKPVRIMFIGINGAGKTTTIAKVAKLLMNSNKKVVFAAADTFRAAAIEQMSVHADRLGVKVIKRDYGSDPTSVAYDAVNYAKAHGMDAVLIDTAGRQDTNISLINEMKKMRRVIEPDLTIYIGESIAGNAMIEQISSFNREVGVDAVILTKLDCDPKGGTMLSISRATGIPIIYVGVGQKYEDLERFDPSAIASRIVD
ncbi:signal recognition particle-docking protein FtsY [Candidatus Micrarchaeota archaeon]|nr:signal recognition particle-docking protein FtsY [Candidatus Micrarchaeota archaeon]